jgi:hypothetical protein
MLQSSPAKQGAEINPKEDFISEDMQIKYLVSILVEIFLYQKRYAKQHPPTETSDYLLPRVLTGTGRGGQ